MWLYFFQAALLQTDARSAIHSDVKLTSYTPCTTNDVSFPVGTSRRSFRLPISLILVVIAIAFVFDPSNPINLTGAEHPGDPCLLHRQRLPPVQADQGAHRAAIFTCTPRRLQSVVHDQCRWDRIPAAYGFGGDTIITRSIPRWEARSSMLPTRMAACSISFCLSSKARAAPLTDHIGNVISPSFSPDGRRILFANRAAEGPTSLWTIDTTGENADLLYSGPNTIVAADWAPVGKPIAFAMAVDQPDAYEDLHHGR